MSLPEIDPPRLAKPGLGGCLMAAVVNGQSVGQDLRLRQWKPMTGRVQEVLYQGILICRGEECLVTGPQSEDTLPLTRSPRLDFGTPN